MGLALGEGRVNQGLSILFEETSNKPKRWLNKKKGTIQGPKGGRKWVRELG